MQSSISQDHVRHIIEALVHKYTMRSKAHKTLCQDFIKTWVLDQSALATTKTDKIDVIVDPLLHQSEQAFADPEATTREKGKLHFDTFIEMCLFENEPFVSPSTLSQSD